VAYSEAKLHRSKYPPSSEKRRAFVVTGGNAGFGFELCEILRSSGVTIYVASRSQASLLSHHLFYTSTFPTAKADQGGSRNQSHHLHLLNPQNRRQAQFPPSKS
jgi:NAD(P)-dependent dehydrogenase (short-subunit alcohol dehydrogenase family)